MIKRSLLYVAALAIGLIFASGQAVGQSSNVRPRTTTSIVTASPVVVGDPDTGLLRLISQTSAVGPNGVWSMKVSIPDLDPGLTAVLNLHDRSRSRLGFQNSLDIGQLGTVLDSSGEIALDDIPQDLSGALTFHIDLNDGALEAEPGQVQLQREGIYPVLLELRDVQGNVLDRLLTHLIRLPEAQQDQSLHPLRVALGVDLRLPPAHQPDDTIRISDESSERLSNYLDVLVQLPAIPVTIRYNPETIETLEASQNVTDQLLYDALTRETNDLHIVGPYVDIDRSALINQGLEQSVIDLVERGKTVLDELDPGSISQYTWISESRLAEQEAKIHWNEGKRRLVLPQSSLTNQFPPPPATPRLPFDLDLEGSSFRVFALDNDLQSYFTNDDYDDPVLRAHYLLAELSLLFFSDLDQVGGAVIVPPRIWDPNPIFLTTLLDGITRSQLLDAVSMERIFQLPNDLDSSGNKVARSLRDPIEQVALLERDDYDLTVQRLESFGSMVEDSAGEALVRHLTEQLPISLSADLSSESRIAYWNNIRATLDSEFDHISAPPSTSFTLTAREDEVPLRFRNDSDYPLRVRVEFASDKLDFPKGNTIQLVLEPNSVTDHNVSVQVRSTGSFPMTVRVWTADREMPIVESRITIRSSVLSGAGAAMTISALVILALWWGRHIIKTRKLKQVNESLAA